MARNYDGVVLYDYHWRMHSWRVMGRKYFCHLIGNYVIDII